MSFSPYTYTDSKVIPGVKFTNHKMGIARRSALDFETLDLRQRMRELEMDYPPQSPEEKKLGEYLEVARKKALHVPADQFDQVWADEVTPLLEQLAAAAMPDIKKARTRLDMEFAAVDARIRVRWVLAGLVKLEGGEVDGMSAEDLVSHGPPQLALEIYDALIADAQTGGTAAKNSKSPGTSGVVVDGATNNTTAATVENTTSTKSETALNTSPVS